MKSYFINERRFSTNYKYQFIFMNIENMYQIDELAELVKACGWSDGKRTRVKPVAFQAKGSKRT